MSPEDWPTFAVRDKPLPYGLMSLSEMINCHVSSLCKLFAQLMFEVVTRERDCAYGAHPASTVGDDEKRRIKGWLEIATNVANDFEWQAVHDRIDIFSKKLNGPISQVSVLNEYRVLKETIEKGLANQLIYRYPHEQGAVLRNWKRDWAPVLEKFPSARDDILAAVDTWALRHFTASVFHCMRVLEHGLRALAREVGKSFEIDVWQTIIEQIEAEIRSLGKTLPRGSEKSDRLQFLSEAAKEFVYFKDGWRNYVSHNRSVYDAYQARGTLEHVKAFMTVLSSRLAEQPPSEEQSS